MAKISLAGFKDPVRRPRYIVWTFVAVFGLAIFMIIALGATSTRFFCAEVCHKVQDDTIASYEASAHSEISCMACHEPVNADPLTFVIKKASSLGELITTVTNKFHLPLNEGSALSLNEDEMGSQQCTQCHSAKRKVTPSAGMIIDHKVHAAEGIWCTVCHNRTAHNEVDAPPQLRDPFGNANTAHPDFMKMNACFRCHDLSGQKGPKWSAPGKCSTCHLPSFNLVPDTHTAADWMGKGHSAAASAADEAYGEGLAEAKSLTAEGVPAQLAAPVQECYECHDKTTFCDACHARLKVSTTTTPAP
jgi:hypothetical protein